MNILIIDDDLDLLEQLEHTLVRRKYTVKAINDSRLVVDMVFEQPFDLILLDVMMPHRDGLSVLREIREEGLGVPVLMLTARGDLEDRVAGLDLGADDYLAKPFSMSELMARIRALLRRTGQKSPILQVGSVTLNTMSREVFLEGAPLMLTAKEFSILELLLHNKGSVVSRFNLAEHVWGEDFDPFSMSNFVDVHMKNLRKKISSEENKGLIRTVRGIGFIIDEI